MFTACQRKQHAETFAVIFSCFLSALGICRFEASTAKSPSAISRFLNEYSWSTRTLIRVMRTHTLEAFHDYLRGRRGRPHMIEIIVDTTSIAKEGQFDGLDGWIHTLNHVHGVHIVMLYICCGELRLPWGFRIWRGKGTPSPQDLALRLVRQLPKEILSRSKHLHFLGDAGFSSVKLLKGLAELGFKFTVGIRGDRLTTKGHQLRERSCQELPVELKGLEGLSIWMYWIWLPGKSAPQQRFIITNHRRTHSSVRKTGRRRWKIEALFKTLKSRFAFGKFGQKTKVGVLRYLFLSLAAFLLCHFEHLDALESGQEVSSWPDWGELAAQVRMKFLGWVRLIEIELEKQKILVHWDAEIT